MNHIENIEFSVEFLYDSMCLCGLEFKVGGHKRKLQF
jgi:hypothetical protein